MQQINQLSFRKVYTEEFRELLDESILTKATVKILSDMTRLNVTKVHIGKNM